MFRINIKCKETSFSQHLGVAAPIQLAGSDFSIGGQGFDRCLEGRKAAVMEKPRNCNRSKRCENKLRQQEPSQFRAPKRRHSAWREGFGKGGNVHLKQVNTHETQGL